MYELQEKVLPEKVDTEPGVFMDSKRMYILPEKVHTEPGVYMDSKRK